MGGGLGYLAPDDPALRTRGALVGAGTGALMGGLGGALASGGLQPDEVSKMQDVVFGAGRAAGHKAGVRKGFNAGRESIVNNLPTDVPMTQAIKDMLLSKIRGGL